MICHFLKIKTYLKYVLLFLIFSFSAQANAQFLEKLEALTKKLDADISKSLNQNRTTESGSLDSSPVGTWGEFGCNLNGTYWIKREQMDRREVARSSFPNKNQVYKVNIPYLFSRHGYKYAESSISITPTGNLVEHVNFYTSDYNNGVPKGESAFLFLPLTHDNIPRMYLLGYKARDNFGKIVELIKDGKYLEKNVQSIPFQDLKYELSNSSFNVFNASNSYREVSLSKCKLDGNNSKKIIDNIDKEHDDLLVKINQEKSFKIKDLTIGQRIDAKCDELVTLPEYLGKVLQYCKFTTTIFEVPFNVNATLLNGKLSRVSFVAKKFPAPNTTNVGIEPIYDSIKINDMSQYSNNLIGKIAETLGQPSISSKRENGLNVIEEVLNKSSGCSVEQHPMYRLTCETRQTLNSREVTGKLRKNCGSCNVDHFVAEWNGEFNMQVISSVPEIQDSPGIFKNIMIVYSNATLSKYVNDYLTDKINYDLKNESILYEKFINSFKSKKEEVNNRQSKDI
jgi:hypothetical protein